MTAKHSLTLLIKTALIGLMLFLTNVIQAAPGLPPLVAAGEKIDDLPEWLIDNRSAYYSVALSYDGRRVASGSSDNTVELWDIESGVLLKTFEGHSGIVWSVALSHDGRRVASGSGDNTVKLWDIHESLKSKQSVLISTLTAGQNGNWLIEKDKYLWRGDDGTFLLNKKTKQGLLPSTAKSGGTLDFQVVGELQINSAEVGLLQLQVTNLSEHTQYWLSTQAENADEYSVYPQKIVQLAAGETQELTVPVAVSLTYRGPDKEKRH